MANRAAAAIENARLFGSLSKRVEENKQLLMEKEELLEGQRNLLESFIRTIAAAIECT